MCKEEIYINMNISFLVSEFLSFVCGIQESLLESVVREMKEETGLTIENPKVCGFKDWIQEDGTRYIVLLYKTDKFTGELKSSDEGRVFWIDRADIDRANLIWNMKELLEIFDTDLYSEFFFKIKDGKYKGELL